MSALIGAFAKMALHSGSLLVAAIITMSIISPLQSYIVSALATHPILVFLPFGVRVLSAFFEGWMSIIYLLPGGVVVNVVYFDGAENDLSGWVTFLAAYAIPPLIFSLLDWQSLEDRMDGHPLKAWRKLLVGGLIAAVTTSLMLHVAEYQSISLPDALASVKMFAVGDFLGLVTLLLVARYVNKLTSA